MNPIKKTYHFLFKKHRKKTLVALVLFLLYYAFCLPSPLFSDPTSMVLEDKDGQLLGARIAADGQWRFPFSDEIPEKFAAAITEFEDRRFYYHPGIDPVGIGRAIQQNISSGRVVSGGSTLTMQVLRMARKNKPRNVWNKALEALMATRLELTHSKEKILAYYAANAPFGGNVVGLEAASWRYYGKRPALLSWSEAATLAVLPNAPSLIHPGKNRKLLVAKRNRLLDRLLKAGKIDALTCELAKEEPLPDKPLALPRLAPHLLERVYAEQIKGKKDSRSKLRTTVDYQLQKQLNQVAKRHHNNLKQNGINNLAAIILDVETGNVLAYLGNVYDQESGGQRHEVEVDVAAAPRSTGSIIKPILYHLLLNEGGLLPTSLVSDIPTHLQGYHPENFNNSYDGAVVAQRAISRSLNVPSVIMLKQYGIEKFHFELNKMGFSTITKSPSHYGLPLILGGAEVRLDEITNAYACMARTLNHYTRNSSRYDSKDLRGINYIHGKEVPKSSDRQLLNEAPRFGAGATWLTFQAMQEVERPNSEGAWQLYESSSKVAWKTGTSIGFRDAWAVGVTPKYAVGVWVGNADGEGRPGLVGVRAAAPVLFDLLDLLPYSAAWFEQPFDDMLQLPVCSRSGFRALDICEADRVDTVWVAAKGVRTAACPFHKIIHLDATEQWQVHGNCESPANMVHQSRFVLPAIEEHYYKTKNPTYRVLPPFREDCLESITAGQYQPMSLIYPKKSSKIYVPKDLDGEKSRTVFDVAHRNPKAIIYWHVDQEYLGATTQFHQMDLNPSPGKHLLTLVDGEGHRLQQEFEILE